MADFDEPRVYKMAKNKLTYSISAIILITFGLFLDVRSFDLGYLIFLGLFAIYLFSPFLYKLIVSNKAISSINFFSTKTLEWSEIAEVRSKNNGVFLVNSDSSIKILVKSQIDDYADVIEFIKQKCSDLWNTLNAEEFHQGFLENIIIFIVGLGLVFLMAQITISDSFSKETIIVSLFGFAISAFLIWSGLSKIRKVAIDGETLTVSFLFWKREYHVTEIQSVALQQKMEKNLIKYPVIVRMKNGKQVVIEKVKEGNPFLLNALEQWLKIYQRPVPQSTHSLENL